MWLPWKEVRALQGQFSMPVKLFLGTAIPCMMMFLSMTESSCSVVHLLMPPIILVCDGTLDTDTRTKSHTYMFLSVPIGTDYNTDDNTDAGISKEAMGTHHSVRKWYCTSTILGVSCPVREALQPKSAHLAILRGCLTTLIRCG